MCDVDNSVTRFAPTSQNVFVVGAILNPHVFKDGSDNIFDVLLRFIIRLTANLSDIFQRSCVRALTFFAQIVGTLQPCSQ